MVKFKKLVSLLLALSLVVSVFTAAAAVTNAAESDKAEDPEANAVDEAVDAEPEEETAPEKDEADLQPAGADIDLAQEALGTPVITGFDSLDSGVKIMWKAVSDAARYRVFYKGKNGWKSMGDTTSTSFIDTDVSSGTTYIYSVRCVSSDGSSFTSLMDTTGKSYTYNMSTPKITDITSKDTGVRITWSKVTNASRYRVFYKNSKGSWVKMADIAGTSYLDSDVRWGNTYTYTVRCVNSSGRFTSGYSSTGWKHKHYLDTPKITKMTSSSKGVLIKWSSVPYSEGYRLYYKNSKGSWVKMAVVDGLTYLDSDVNYGKTYTYTIRCVNSRGDLTSDYIGAGWKHTHYMDTPSVSSFFSSGKGVVITWNDVGAAKYRVYYYGSKGWTNMGETAGTGFTDSDVKVGKTYRYTVRGITKDGSRFTTDFDSDGWKYTYKPSVQAPSFKSSETVSNGVKLTWNSVSNANRYRVYYKNKSGSWVKMGDTTGTSFVDTDVKDGTTYTYAVRCLAAKGDDFASGYSSLRSHTYVGVPSITSFENKVNGIRITWTAKTGAKKYRIFYKNRSGSWVKMADTSSTSYLDTDVARGKTYTYTVRCMDADGNYVSYYNTTGWKQTYYSNAMLTKDEAKAIAESYWSSRSSVGHVSGGDVETINNKLYYHFRIKILNTDSGFYTTINDVYVEAYTGEVTENPRR